MRQPAKFNGVVLEKLCHTCHGSGKDGKIFFGLADGMCCTCYGCGYEMTEDGLALCHFIESHMDSTEGRFYIKPERFKK